MQEKNRTAVLSVMDNNVMFKVLIDSYNKFEKLRFVLEINAICNKSDFCENFNKRSQKNSHKS